MKPASSVPVPGETPWERLDSAVRTIFKVPKEALQKEQAKAKQRRTKKKRAKKAA
jgi:hypothetical protein